jgi:hypothetical protein
VGSGRVRSDESWGARWVSAGVEAELRGECVPKLEFGNEGEVDATETQGVQPLGFRGDRNKRDGIAKR